MKRSKSVLGANVVSTKGDIDASNITDNWEPWETDLPLLYALESDATLANDYLTKISAHWTTVDGDNT